MAERDNDCEPSWHKDKRGGGVIKGNCSTYKKKCVCVFFFNKPEMRFELSPHPVREVDTPSPLRFLAHYIWLSLWRILSTYSLKIV